MQWHIPAAVAVTLLAPTLCIAQARYYSPPRNYYSPPRNYHDPPPVQTVPKTIPAQQSLHGTVVRIVDGETIAVDVNGIWETVRLIGIGPPETVDSWRTVHSFGKEAADYMARVLLQKTVMLTTDQGNSHIGHRDRHGRLLAYVWLGDVLFNERIIREGFARAHAKYPYRQDYVELFREAERSARMYRRGIWASSGKGSE